MQRKQLARLPGVLAAIGFAAQLSACGGGTEGNPVVPQGTVRVAITNTGASSCGYDEVNVTIASVRVNPNASAQINDSGWQPYESAISPPKKVNLLTLTNGSRQDIVTLTVPAGHYAQVRLRLEQSMFMQLANSVVLSGSGTNVALATGSATDSGIGLAHEFDVPANGQAGLLLDFDGCQSVKPAANGALQLIPVLTVATTPGT